MVNVFSHHYSFTKATIVSLALVLLGCGGDKDYPILAPAPPLLPHHNANLDDDYIPPVYEPAGMIDGAQMAVHSMDDARPVTKCRTKDRFDRAALLAYEWDRSRLSFDVDGVNMSGDNAGFLVEYKLRFQPEKTKKQRCRYDSQWQGLLGSGYNELMLREDDRVHERVRSRAADIFRQIDDSI